MCPRRRRPRHRRRRPRASAPIAHASAASQDFGSTAERGEGYDRSMWNLKRVLDLIALGGQIVEEEGDATLLDIGRSLQLDSYSCGAQSAFMILRYYGKARSPAAVARALGTNEENGTSGEAIRSLFRQRGLRSVVRSKATLRDLKEAIDAEAPALVSLDDEGHWGVVYGYSRQKVYLADPSIRRSWRVACAKDAFRERWDRWAMIVHRDAGDIGRDRPGIPGSSVQLARPPASTSARTRCAGVPSARARTDERDASSSGRSSKRGGVLRTRKCVLGGVGESRE